MSATAYEPYTMEIVLDDRAEKKYYIIYSLFQSIVHQVSPFHKYIK